MSYVPVSYLDNLKKYKYSVIDASPLSKHVLQPYWNYMIRFMPWWIAPNLITLIGTIALVVNWFILWYFVPHFSNPAPQWVYLFSAIAMEWYSLMDNLDGRQARRTQTSSPLGELFDHGCDCVAVALAAVIADSIYQFGPGYHSLCILILTAGGFWFATWEEYHTGTLYLGYFNGPTEGIKLVSLAYLVTFIFGSEMWTLQVTELVPFLPSALSWIAVRDVLVFGITGASTVLPSLMSVHVVMTNPRNASFDRKMRAFGHMLTYFIYWGLVVIWYNNSTGLWQQYPHIMHMGVGMGFAEMASRLILAHLCHMDYAVLQRPMLPLVVVSIGSLVQNYAPIRPFVPEEVIMWIYVAINVLCFFHYTVSVINELCAYLGIRPLTIPHKVHAK